MSLTPLATTFLASGAAMAAEGMWMPQQLPTISKALKENGLAIDPAKLSKLTEFPMGAIVSLTAHFLSQYLAQPASQLDPAFLSALRLKPGMSEAEVQAHLVRLNGATQLARTEDRLAWLAQDASAFKASQDPYIQAAVALHEHDRAREARMEESAGLRG
ncbi:MAG: hypothetical protein E6Q92_13200, partial [Burkholderiaceae bacterium]